MLTSADCRPVDMLRIFVIAALVVLAAAGTITQDWFTDANCTEGSNIVRVDEGKCYFDQQNMNGMEWTCAAGAVQGVVYGYMDTNCTGTPIGKRSFLPNKCSGPIYNNLYLIASGC